MQSPGSLWVGLATLAAFGASLGGTVLVAGLLDEEQPPALAFGAATATAGFRQVDDPRPFFERVVTVSVPYTYRGEWPSRYILSLLVADDPGFVYPVGSATLDLTLSAREPEGVATLTARVRGGGTFYWEVSPSLLAGEGPAPPGVSGTVALREPR